MRKRECEKARKKIEVGRDKKGRKEKGEKEMRMRD